MCLKYFANNIIPLSPFYIAEVLSYSNYDLKNIFTPVKADVFNSLLKQAGYNERKRLFLYRGFSRGFSLQYKGKLQKVQRYALNLRLTVGSPIELWNKVMTEVKAKRYAGPYDKVPYKFFMQSPIGLVPKNKGRKTRLIFHLSYPKDGDSVNSGIPEKLCKVKYPEFDQAIRMCLEAGISCSIAKSDMSMAFRHAPLSVGSWRFLILKCKNPLTGKTHFFVEKCLSFGSSISCAIFQAISDGIAFVVKYRIESKSLLNYLDDYFFAALRKLICDQRVQKFLEVCAEISFPVSMEKTVWGTTVLVFLGLLIDTEEQMVRIPLEKVNGALDLLEYLVNRRNKTVTVLHVQRLCGTLNFLTKCIIPGRVFLTRTYSIISNPNLKQYHHVRITEEVRQDMITWKKFLEHQSVFNRPFLDVCNERTSLDIDMYSDASGSSRKGGLGAYCGKNWVAKPWPNGFIAKNKPSIEYL